jgi:hypothetical protein
MSLYFTGLLRRRVPVPMNVPFLKFNKRTPVLTLTKTYRESAHRHIRAHVFSTIRSNEPDLENLISRLGKSFICDIGESFEKFRIETCTVIRNNCIHLERSRCNLDKMTRRLKDISPES